METTHRFRVMKEEGIIKIYGLVSEDVRFEKISEHLKGRKMFL